MTLLELDDKEKEPNFIELADHVETLSLLASELAPFLRLDMCDGSELVDEAQLKPQSDVSVQPKPIPSSSSSTPQNKEPADVEEAPGLEIFSKSNRRSKLTFEEVRHHLKVLAGITPGSVDESKAAILLDNINRVYGIAKQRAANYYFGLEDCAQAGFEALYEGLDRFDPTYGGEIDPDSEDFGITFHEWANQRVYGGIIDAMRKNDQFGTYHARKVGRLSRLDDDELTAGEADFLDKSIVVSLDVQIDHAPNNGDVDIYLADTIADPMDTAEEAMASLDEVRLALDCVLSAARRLLSEKNKLVFDLLYDLDCPRPTLAEVGRTIGLTESRIGQIDKIIMQKIRLIAERQGLENPFYDDTF